MNAPTVIPNETLPSLIDKATQALDSARNSAEVLEARDMARVAYDAAKIAGRMAKAKKAHDSLVSEVHRSQAHALAIRARAEMRLAEEYDAAQERGEVAGHGRSNVEPANVTTAADLGLRRDEIHEARKLRDAEKADPGLIQRTVDTLADSGQEPTRAALQRSVKAAVADAKGGSRKNPLHRSDAHRDAVIAFTGACRRVAENDQIAALAAFQGHDSFRDQMIEQANAAANALVRFFELVEMNDA